MDNLLSNLGNTLHSGVANLLNYIDSVKPVQPAEAQSNVIGSPSDMKITYGSQPLLSSPQPSPQPQANFSPDSIRAGIASKWGQDNPLLSQADALYQAGRSLPKNIDPYLPTILALRETQGGKDLLNAQKAQNLGKNNIFNIRGTQNGQNKFIDYPDVKTAILGGQNGPYTSQGFTGLINNNPIYQDFRNSGNPADLFKSWSPPTDNNGNVAQQVQNYNWIRSQFK